MVALTADHGEAFGEHGEESHSLFVYDVTLRVPLILRAPGWPPAAACRGRCRIVDLGATLLSLAGAPARFPGTNLLAAARGGRGPSTRRRSRRASTSAGASCARSATGATS